MAQPGGQASTQRLCPPEPGPFLFCAEDPDSPGLTLCGLRRTEYSRPPLEAAILGCANGVGAATGPGLDGLTSLVAEICPPGDRNVRLSGARGSCVPGRVSESDSVKPQPVRPHLARPGTSGWLGNALTDAAGTSSGSFAGGHPRRPLKERIGGSSNECAWNASAGRTRPGQNGVHRVPTIG